MLLSDKGILKKIIIRLFLRLTLSKKVDIERDLTEKNDEKIAFFAKQDPKIEQCSPQNQKTYDEVNASLKKLIAMYIE